MRLLVAATVLMSSAAAFAQPGAAETRTQQAEEHEEAEPDSESDIAEREVPNYDGREQAPPTAGEVLLWIPRLLLAPIWLVTEFIIRRPLGFVVTNAEEAEIPDKVVQFFTFGPDNNVALAPTFSFDFGFRPNVGIYFRWNEFLHEDHKLRAGFSFGGVNWLSGSLAYRIAPDDENWEIQIGGNAIKRQDGLFFGIGEQASEANRSRFDWVGYDAVLTARGSFWRQSNLLLELGYRNRQFGDDLEQSKTTIPERVEEGRFDAPPPGYEDGISIVRQSARLTIDSRRSRPDTGHGVRVTGGYEVAFDANAPGQQMWIKYGGAIAGFVDAGGQRLIGLHVSAAASEAFAGSIPFTELNVLSGNGPLRGFVGNFLSGESSFSILADYHWPVWNWLDGTLHVAVGNVYDGQFEDMAFENMRLSFGIGLAGVSQRDHFFEFLVGFGTDTFEDGPDIESVRILFGGTREF